MGERDKQAERLLQADFCRKMADRANDPERKVAWLTLAQRWLLLGDAPRTSEAAQFEALLDERGTRQTPSETEN